MSYGASGPGAPWGATAPLVAQPGGGAPMFYKDPPKPVLPPLSMSVIPNRTDIAVGVFGPIGSRNNPYSIFAYDPPGPRPGLWGNPNAGAGAAASAPTNYSQIAVRALAEYEAASDPELAAAKLEVQLKNWKGYVKSYPMLKPVLQPQIDKAEAKLKVYQVKTGRSLEAYGEARQLSLLTKVALAAGTLTLLAGAALLGTRTYKESKRANGKRRRRRNR
jgi:hypothetical protein